MGRHRGGILRSLTVTAVLLTALGTQAVASGPPNSTAAEVPSLLPAGRTYTMTLLTGDVMTVHTRESGCPAVTVRPADPSGVLQRSCDADGRVRVVPGVVAPLLGHVLDESLFDVTTLIQEGYDDASTAELPLIVRSTGSTARTDVTGGLRGKREPRSIDAVAGRQPKATAPALVRSLTGSMTTAATQPSTTVWLDRRVRALDAPTSAGRTG